MDNRYRILILPLIVLLATSLSAEVWSQQLEQEPDVAPPEDPAVLAVLETNPSTREECVRAAKILADLGRPDLSKQFLRRVIDAKPSQEELTGLIDKFGSAMFVGMAAKEELLPEAKQLADAILAAANRQLQDPKRIAKLIEQLQDPTPDARYRALAGLKEARSAAVGPMVDVLADANRADEHPNVRAALVRMRSEAIEPLIGILEKSDPKLMAQAIRVLAQMDAKEAAIYLLGPYTSEMSDPAIREAAGAALGRLFGHLPTKRQAIRLLTEQAKAYFDRSQPLRADADGQVELWSWDVGNKQCIRKKYPAEDAAVMVAARLARDAYALSKDDPEIRRLYLATMLEAAACETGLDQPLQEGKGTAAEEAAGFGVEVIEAVMEYAIAGEHVAAATAAARILGKKGTAGELLRQGPEPAPLVQATRHPDRRLRMAAADAIVQLQPLRPFAGSSYVPQSLAFFAASSGVRRALVASSSTETSRRLAGILAAKGFEVDTATTGRELMRLAVASPDYEMALIDAAIEQPAIDMLLQQVRRDCRTATLRVGLISRSGYLQGAKRIARRDPLVLAFSRPHIDQAAEWQMEQLSSLAPRAFVPHAERQRQAAEALGLLAELSGSSSKLYDLRRVEESVLASLYAPNLSTQAAAVLGNLNSAASQRALVDLASRWTQPLQVRKAAVKAFGRNTEAHGILLTADEITRQYDRYNQSENLDPATQHVLGLILDYIEAPTQPVKVQQEGGRGKAEGGE